MYGRGFGTRYRLRPLGCFSQDHIFGSPIDFHAFEKLYTLAAVSEKIKTPCTNNDSVVPTGHCLSRVFPVSQKRPPRPVRHSGLEGVVSRFAPICHARAVRLTLHEWLRANGPQYCEFWSPV